MSALITDADQGRCYIIARSLSKRGIKVTVAGEDGHKNMAFYSKHCYNRVLYPAPDKNQKEFLKTIMKTAKFHNVLIPLHERTIVPLSRHLDQFKKFIKIPIPPYDILKIALDKAKTMKMAQSIGVPIPNTHFINTLEELKTLSKHLRFPVIIKLREEIFTPPPRYQYAYSQNDFINKYLLMHKKCEYPLVQELIPGTGCGFFTIFNENSDPIALFCHRRIREYPITGGPSAYCESIYEPKIIYYGLKLLRKIRWYGVAMVEFRLDSRDGEFKLMEINPRFWGSLPLAIASGVDFPYLLYQMATGKNIKCNKYKIGVKCRFLVKDFLALKQALREANNKLSYLKSFLKSFLDQYVTYGDISLNDFGPTGYYFLSNYRRVLKRKQK